MYFFLSGAIMAGCAAVALFFLRFWQDTHDRFFLSFSLSFWLLGLERFFLVVFNNFDEHKPYIYITRLVAFSLILWALVEKNRESDRSVHSAA
jgi:hypothetical protein